MSKRFDPDQVQHSVDLVYLLRQENSMQRNSSAASVDAAELRRAAGCFPTGVAVITTADKRGICYGLTANSVTSLSLDPPLFLFCVDRKSETLPMLLGNRVFAINILSQEQKVLSQRFATKYANKFADIVHHIGQTGAPLLEGALAIVEGQIVQSFSGGDHVILVGHVEYLYVNEGEPLVFYRGKYTQLGS